MDFTDTEKARILERVQGVRNSLTDNIIDNLWDAAADDDSRAKLRREIDWAIGELESARRGL